MEANAEIRRKYEETINHLFKLLITVCQERDEARDQLQVLLRNLQPSTHFTPQQVDHHHHPQVHPPIFLQYKTKPSNIVENIKELDTITSSSKTCPYELSLATLHPSSSNEKLSRTAESSNLALQKNVFSRDHDKLDDSSSLVIDKLVLGKPLPQKGNLLRTVTEAGPLLRTLLVAPLPEWQNPPPSSSTISSCCLAPFDDQASAHQNSAIVVGKSRLISGNQI